MFGHIYINRLKCIVRDRQTMFWTFLFPILLALFFNMSLSNVTKGEVFSDIPVAVIENAESQDMTTLKGVLAETDLFQVTYATKDEAEQLLGDGKITGYIYEEDGFKLAVKKSGLQQTVIKAFLDDYTQTVATVGSILETNPAAAETLFRDLANRKHYLKAVSAGRAAPDLMVNYFYTLIAMSCMYGGFLGLKEIMAVQANLSAQAARMNMAPTHKMKLCIASIFAAVTIQLAIIFLQLAFLVFVLGINFGSQLGYIGLTCFVGAFVGVTFGAAVAAAVKSSENIKVAILISGSMLMSMLAGMMFHDMKVIIATNAPIIGYLNPVNLLADSFYKLYYYNTYTQFFTNIIILCGFAVLFSLITYLVLRRQKYASL